METLSVAVITLNEEDNIEDCLRSVAFADEIVIVDAGSSDRTLEIAAVIRIKSIPELARLCGSKEPGFDLCSRGLGLESGCGRAGDR